MIFERVNFNEEQVRRMSREEFEATHIGVLWPDRDEDTRRRMLSEAYSLVCPPARSGRKGRKPE